MEEQPDATLAELQERLLQKTAVSISVATVDRMFRLRLNLSFKKKSPSDLEVNRASSTGSIWVLATDSPDSS